MRQLELVPGLVRVSPEAPRELEQQPAARFVAWLGPGVDGPARQAPRGVRHDERLVVLERRPEAVALAAGAPRVVEGEQRRRDGGCRSVAGAAGGEARESEPVGARG